MLFRMLGFISRMSCFLAFVLFFFKQKTAYEVRISDWSSDVCSSDLQTAHGLDRLQCLVALTNPATEDHHLLELRLHRTVDTQVGEVARQPSDQLGVEHVGRHDEDQHAAVLQQRQRTLIEQLFQPRTALALIADVAVHVLAQVAIRRVQPQQPEGLARDQRVHQVTVDAAIDQLPCVAGTLRSEEHTSELQSLMRTSYAVFCLKKKKEQPTTTRNQLIQRKNSNHKSQHGKSKA